MNEIKALKTESITEKELASERIFSHILLATVILLMAGLLLMIFLYSKEQFDHAMSGYDCLFEQLIQSHEGR